ncbi:Phage excisionase |nr:Phage excisionase \
MTAVAGTVFIAAGAFWLSFTALADLAARSGVGAAQAWAWPLIVDGIIVVATVAVVALAGHRSAWYPWALLAAGAVVSVTANAIHAVVAADADVPGVLAASVAAVPPLVLLAITHLTVILTRPIPAPQGGQARASEPSAEPSEAEADGLSALAGPVPVGREVAVLLREEEGWSNKQIARHLGVHPSTVGRWFARPALPAPESEETL